MKNIPPPINRACPRACGGGCNTPGQPPENTTENARPIDPAPQRHDASAALERSGRHARTGKIARLPLEIREELNKRLLNGQEGRPLVDWLNGHPAVQAVMAAHFQGSLIREQNLSEWRKGGHQDWKRDQEAHLQVSSFLERVGGMQEVAKDGLTNQLALFLSARMVLEFQRLDRLPDGDEKSKIWRELTACLVALRRGDLEMERLRLQRERYGLRHKSQEEREAEFWKWAEDNINRDEFCRRRCFTYEEREAAIDKILGITPEERHETVPEDQAQAQDQKPAAEAPPEPGQSGPDPASIQPQSDLDPASIRPRSGPIRPDPT